MPFETRSLRFSTIINAKSGRDDHCIIDPPYFHCVCANCSSSHHIYEEEKKKGRKGERGAKEKERETRTKTQWNKPLSREKGEGSKVEAPSRRLL